MQKTILITSSTDGIGLETALLLVAAGHLVLLHGRNPEKLSSVAEMLAEIDGDGRTELYVADLSRLSDVASFATSVSDAHDSLDAFINNAGVFGAGDPVTGDGLDIRFAVNTIALYLFTRRLLPLFGPMGRVVNLSSAAQAPVDPAAMTAAKNLSDNDAYAESKLALTMWSRKMGLDHREQGPMIVAVNPGSLLGSKMVKDAYGVDGGDIQIGADILCKAALDDAFATAHRTHFDNDSGSFASPHPDALDAIKLEAVIRAIDSVLATVLD